MIPTRDPRGKITGFTEVVRRPPNSDAEIAPGLPGYVPLLLHLNIWPGALVPPTPETPLGLPAELMQALVYLATKTGPRISKISPLVATRFRIWSLTASVPGFTPTQNDLFRERLQYSPADAPGLPAGVLPHPLPSASVSRDLRSRLLLTLSTGADPCWFIAALSRIRGVEIVEGVPALYAPRQSEVNDAPRLVDPFAKTVDDEDAFWIHKMTGRDQLPEWDEMLCENIAILDSGAPSTHPLLDGGILPPDPIWFPRQLTDVYGHGTHVTSTAIGRRLSETKFDINLFPHGVLPAAKAWCFNIFRTSPTNGEYFELSVSAFYTALYTIRKHPSIKVDVINLSIWMKDEPGDTLMKEFARQEAAGKVLVACAGNYFDSPSPNKDLGKDSLYRVLYPARLPNFLSVGAITGDYQRAPFSRFSTWNTYGRDGNDYFATDAGRFPLVDVVAPGVRVWGAALGAPPYPASIQPHQFSADGNYGAVRLKGTSMAAPQVTAAVAVLRHTHTGLSPEDVRTLVRASTDLTDMQSDFGSSLIKREEALGSGLLDFAKLLQLAAG